MNRELPFILMLVWGISGTAVASGSHSAYSQNLEERYDRGKKVFLEKLVCESCRYSQTELLPETVLEILADLDHKGALGQTLSVTDRRSVAYFLKRRFGR